MKDYSHQSKARVLSFSIVALSLLILSGTASAYFLDNFSTGKTGWTDTLNGGTVVGTGGQFVITTATANGSLTYSYKTASPTYASLGVSFAPVSGDTLEIRTDVNNSFNASQDANALAVLGLVPSGGTILTAGGGYALVVGANDVKVLKGATVLYATNGVNFAMTNIQMVLRITPSSGGNVLLNVRVYRKYVAVSSYGDANPNYGTAVLDQTVTDPSTSLVGVAGNVALAVQNVANPSGSTLTFDNLQVWDIINSTLDDFSSGNLNNWNSFTANTSGDSVTTHDGLVDFLSKPNANGGFAGIVYKNRSFTLIDGARVEFAVDIINNPGGSGGAHSYSVIGFVPGTGATAVSLLKGLIEYHLAFDAANTYNGKTYNGWWGHTVGAFPTASARITMTMTGQRNSEGTNVVVESRGEDLTKDVNDPARLFYQNVIVDTPLQDSFEKGAYALSAGTWAAITGGNTNRFSPFVNPPVAAGSFAIDIFNDSVTDAQVQMDNAVFNQTLPPNLPPILNNISPVPNAESVVSSSHLSFDAVDDINLAATGIVVKLNGVSYNSASPGVTITGNQTARHFDLSGALSPNVNYTGTVVLTDANGASNVTSIAFDTFVAANIYTVESEEYNFGGGQFIDNPALIAEGGTQAGAYNGQVGTVDIDFHDNRGAVDGAAYDHTFRTDDPLRTQRSADLIRAKYDAAGGAAANYYEEEIEDINNGDWMNYTHHYPAGTYNAFLRQSQYAVPVTATTLDLVTSDPTMTGQTTTVLGTFLGNLPGGPTEEKNVPLVDTAGNPVVLRFNGSQKTLRVSVHDTINGATLMNYFALVPVPDPGTLRPVISYASPTPGSAIAPTGGNNSSAPATTLTIANRDTTVNIGTVVFKLNGAVVGSAVVAPVTGGATVTWPLSSLPPTQTITNTLSFSDSDGTNQTFTWTYSYPFLAGNNSLPPNALTTRGWNYRMVQTADVLGGGNSLGVAEAQLNGTIPEDVTSSSVEQLLYWSDDNCTPQCVPGLGSSGHDNIAIEALGYVHLTAGAHRFHVESDDGWRFASGTVVPGFRDGGTYSGYWDFIAETDGLYPVRFVWYEHGGGANLRVRTVNLSDNSEQELNDNNNPSGVVQVYVPPTITLLSSATVNGPYNLEGGAVIDTNAKTATIAISGSTRFYRMTGVTKITNIKKVGSNMVLTYQ